MLSGPESGPESVDLHPIKSGVQINITSYVHFLIYVYKYIVIESQFMYEL